MGPKQVRINDEVVNAWISGLPNSVEGTIIVSLLGRKPEGLSEFSYYSFRGGFDQSEDRPGCPAWQEWLSERFGSTYCVCEFPTVDTEPVPEVTKKLVVSAILRFMHSGKTVILVDSGGVGRTGNVVSTMKKMEVNG